MRCDGGELCLRLLRNRFRSGNLPQLSAAGLSPDDPSVKVGKLVSDADYLAIKREVYNRYAP